MSARIYYQDEAVTLFHGDCREVLPDMAAVDAVFADPPYGETSLDWDVWPDGWAGAAARVAPQLWCFGSFRMFLDRAGEFEKWKLGQDLVWEKHNGSSLHNDRFRKVHELAVHWYAGKWGDLYLKKPEEVVEDGRRGRMIRSRKPAHFGKGSGGSFTYGDKRLTRSVIAVASCHGEAVNETQKPEGIVRPLMEYSVPPGGIVFDCFTGSGTVLAVAKASGRRAIGVEKREEQCERAAERLQQTMVLAVMGAAVPANPPPKGGTTKHEPGRML